MTAQTILPANSAASGGFEVANSIRLDENAYLHKTPSGSGNRKTWTASVWVKGQPTTTTNNIAGQAVFSAGDSATDRTHFYFTNGIFEFRTEISNTQQIITTNQVFTDPAAWYHIVVAVDSTQSTDTNRVKIYANGVQITSFSAAAYLAEDADTYVNHTVKQYVGSSSWSVGSYFNGYMAEFVLLDGTAATPTSFGEFDEDSGIWKPISVSGLTFGTNGFYLDFKDSSALGNDANGSNNWTSNNFAAINQSTDTCTNNFATLNPLDVYASKTGALSEGNLKLTATNSQLHTAVGTIAPSSGKWYLEVELDAKSGSNNSNVGISDLARDDKSNMPSKLAWGYGYNPDGTKQNSGSDSSYGDSYAAGDILGVAMDLDNGAVYFSKNGTFQASGDPTSGASKTNAAFTWTPDASMTWAPYVADNTSGVAFTWITNFGNPIVTGTDQTDGNSRGSFEYAVPSGYLSLCTKNLASTG